MAAVHVCTLHSSDYFLSVLTISSSLTAGTQLKTDVVSEWENNTQRRSTWGQYYFRL